MFAKESALIPLVKNLNTEYTIYPQNNIEETTLYYYQTLEVGQHHTMDPIIEGILSCSLASSRGNPPIEILLQIQYFSSCLITFLEPLYIVLPYIHVGILIYQYTEYRRVGSKLTYMWYPCRI